VPRVKRGTKRHDRRKKLLGLAKGYYLNKSKLYKFAKEAVEKALLYAYRDRRVRKREFRIRSEGTLRRWPNTAPRQTRNSQQTRAFRSSRGFTEPRTAVSGLERKRVQKVTIF